MSDSTGPHPPPPAPPPGEPVATGAPSHEVLVERHVVAAEPERRSSIRPFLAGFLTAVVLGIVGIVAFLAVSESDDDGEIELDVPAVDVDVDN